MYLYEEVTSPLEKIPDGAKVVIFYGLHFSAGKDHLTKILEKKTTEWGALPGSIKQCGSSYSGNYEVSFIIADPYLALTAINEHVGKIQKVVLKSE
ncbi:MAG: hypothetical protein WCV59_05155 [Parcubacteria group bacterium]|jgi:hypothetical protein